MSTRDTQPHFHRTPSFCNLLALCAIAVAPTVVGQPDASDASPSSSRSADDVWAFVDQPEIGPLRATADAYRAARMDQDTLLGVLERVSERRYNEPLPVLTLPMPDGSFARFRIRAEPQPGREAVQAYRGRGLDGGDARLEWTAQGLHAIVSTARGAVYVDPVAGVPGAYITYFATNAGRPLLNGSDLPLAAVRQIETVMGEKEDRDPAQRKIDSRLLDASRLAQGNEVVPAYNRPPVEIEASGDPERTDWYVAPSQDGPLRVLVDLRADVTPELLARIEDLGGEVVNSVGKYRAIRAWMPLDNMETIAALDQVQWIRVADQAITNPSVQRPERVGRTVSQGIDKVDTSQGDVAHDVAKARTEFGVDGTGVGIGVLSNGIGTLADRQASGDIPGAVVVLEGQAGERVHREGTAMLEIVHDLAPSAHLYFATGFGSPAQFAANIEALCEAGADVIVDDIIWFAEAAFQDDVVAKGVNEAVDAGCFYFSAAGNAGNLNDGTAGVWEGDFADAGGEPQVDVVPGRNHHEFADGVSANRITKWGRAYLLKWADPLGASANDHDLYLLDESLTTVIHASTNVQDGEQDPVEGFNGFPDDVGKHLVVVRNEGQARYIRLNAIRGELEHVTAGQTFGHAASESGIGVAAVAAFSAGGDAGVFDGSESVETFSSDGPRRMFFRPDGTPITPGNFSSTGGIVLDKPDIAAADGVSTSTPGFRVFEGTSAAAPHAAAISALMVEAAGGRNQIDQETLRQALAEAALDIEAPGVDRDSGAGIPLAPAAVSAVASDRTHRAPTGTLQDQTLSVDADVRELDLSTTFDDPDGEALTYSLLPGAEGIAAVTLSGTILTIDPLAPGTVTVTIRVTDPGGLSRLQRVAVTVERDYGDTDYDADDDGLIEIANLEQLNALRYDLDGNGETDVPADWISYFEAFDDAQEAMGCADGCTGFELTADLDFEDPGSYASGVVDHGWTRAEGGSGWTPIGMGDDDFPNGGDGTFAANFDGNGHTIANLFINRPAMKYVGLFGQVHMRPITNLGLTAVDVTGGNRVGGLAGDVVGGSSLRTSHATGTVSGHDVVGGLAGSVSVPVRNCYASVRVTGRWLVGGLIGAQNLGSTLQSSFATGTVAGVASVGGLVGSNWSPIVASYATGPVSGEGLRDGRCNKGGVGGLVGHVCGQPVVASYATGPVSGASVAGGIAGSKSITTSLRSNYWDIETSGLVVGVGDDDSNDNGTLETDEIRSPGVGGMTTAELQTPTAYTEIYRDWYRTDVFPTGDAWHFGSSSQYPALRADIDGDGTATWQEFGTQIRERPQLTIAANDGQATLSWTAVNDDHWTPRPELTYSVYRDGIPIATGVVAHGYADTPPAGTESMYQVVAIVDGGEASRSNLVPVHNRPPASPPVADRSARARASFSYTFGHAGEPDGDTVTYSATGVPGWLTFTPSSRTFSGTPADSDTGAADITVTATDDGAPALSSTATFTLTVIDSNASNRAPSTVGTLDAISLPTGSTATVQVADAFEDADGDSLGYSTATSDADVATARISGDAVTVAAVGVGQATVTVTASDGALTADQTISVSVVNAAPEAVRSLADRRLVIPSASATVVPSDAFRDPDGDALTYGATSMDEDVATASTSGGAVTLTPVGVGSTSVTLTATDVGGSNATATQSFGVSVRRDYDVDDDGLIEVGGFSQLDAIRLDLDGDGIVDPTGFLVLETLPEHVAAHELAYPDAAARMGCDSLNGCLGYELMEDLDFDTNGSGDADEGDSHWNDGRGWEPIGDRQRQFQTTFDGNGHVVANLFIDRPDEQFNGLFGLVGEYQLHQGIVRDVGLADVNVSGSGPIGSLVAQNWSLVENCFATGSVRETSRATRGRAAGGLVGWNGFVNVGGVIRRCYAAVAVSADVSNAAGGLVGFNDRGGHILSSFATGSVESDEWSGGLAGSNAGEIGDSYATGRSSTAVSGGLAGGLVGINWDHGVITSSYATGRPTAERPDGSTEFRKVTLGGVASISQGEILRSHWDLQTSGWQVGVGRDDQNRNGRLDSDETATTGASGRTTAELQAPEEGAGIYQDWRVDGPGSWHFGSATQYPVLRADLDGDGQETWSEFGYQLRDRPRLTATVKDGRAELAWTLVDTGHWDPEPTVRYAVLRDGKLLATDLDGSTYTDPTPGLDYQVVALVNDGEGSRSGLAVLVAHCDEGTTWLAGQRCRIGPTSFTFEVNSDGTVCVGSTCSAPGENRFVAHIRAGHIRIVVIADRDDAGAWTLSELAPKAPPNRKPNALGLVRTVTLAPDGDSVTMDVVRFFEDPDGDELTYTAETSESSVATVDLVESILTITSSGEGQATVTATAQDPGGLFATQSIEVTVRIQDTLLSRWARGWRLAIASQVEDSPGETSED
ncbi:MAG: hypothetical protein F4X98_10120 [Gammaproteobacteria bacterium]|nr:hypothetical protein [Gammaproteobacteria bacterium]